MKLATLAIGAAVVLALAGCTANDPFADQYSDVPGQGYISGDGANTEIPPAGRDDPIAFEGEDAAGETITNDDFAGQVYVVNFWFASCPPCRVEAADLKALSEEYTDVPFLGVNISDSADFAATFETTFGIDYPSILDANTATVQLAFAGTVAPNAVPTTVVLDRDGRVAARISGLINKSNLAAMIDTVLAEGT